MARLLLRASSPAPLLPLRRRLATGEELGLLPSKPSLPPLEPSTEADALARLLLAHHNPFHPLESPLQLTGVAVTAPLLVQTLLRLRGASKVALALFEWARAHRPGGAADVAADAYDVVVDALGRARQFDAVWRLIVDMGQVDDDKAGGNGPTERTFAILVRRYVAAGMTRQAVRAFDDMEAFLGREPSAADFHMLLDTLCKYNFPKVATEIFNKRKVKYEPDQKMYNILIYGWCKSGRNKMARKFFAEMLDCGIEPSDVTYNIMLNGICRHASLHPDNRFDRTVHAAEGLLKDMRGRGIEPDITSYSIILHVYSRAHKPELCLHKFSEMRDLGISPTIATYTSVIKCLASCGRLEDAEQMLDQMVSDGICPSPATYNCFFKEYRGRRDVAGALRLYDLMQRPESPTRPDIRTYNILLGMFTSLGKLGTVRKLWADMIEGIVGPDLDSYTLVIHYFCKREMWDEACRLFMEMIEKGFLPQTITFETLYRGLIQADMMSTWRRLKARVDEEAAKFSIDFKAYHLSPYKR